MENSLFESAVRALREKGEFSNKVTGKSMYPMLRGGRDIIIIKPARFPIMRHDVILYRKEGIPQLVLHRVIKPESGGNYLVRGDNTYRNETVNESDVAGVLSGFFRGGRFHDCKKDFFYRVYVILMRLFYPARYLYVIYLRPFLGKVKRAIKKMI